MLKFSVRIGRKAMTLGGDNSKAAIACSSAILSVSNTCSRLVTQCNLPCMEIRSISEFDMHKIRWPAGLKCHCHRWQGATRGLRRLDPTTRATCEGRGGIATRAVPLVCRVLAWRGARGSEPRAARGTRAMQRWPRPQAFTGAGGCDRRVSRKAFQPCMGLRGAAIVMPLLFCGECSHYVFIH